MEKEKANMLRFSEDQEFLEFMKMLNIESDVVLPSLETQMKGKKGGDKADKGEEADGSPAKDDALHLPHEKPPMAPLVQSIVNERETREKRNKEKTEKNGPAKTKKDDKKKKNKPEKQQEKPVYQVKKPNDKQFAKY